MTNTTTTSSLMAWQDVHSSFERFCLTAGIGAIEQMLCEDAQRLVGPRHSRGERVGHRWGATKGKIGFSMAARLLYAGHGCAARATRLRYRPGGWRRPRIGLGAGR